MRGGCLSRDIGISCTVNTSFRCACSADISYGYVKDGNVCVCVCVPGLMVVINAFCVRDSTSQIFGGGRAARGAIHPPLKVAKWSMINSTQDSLNTRFNLRKS